MYLFAQCDPQIDEHTYPSKITDSVSQMKIPELENGSPVSRLSGQGDVLQSEGPEALCGVGEDLLAD
jgi:hypothetical protein